MCKLYSITTNQAAIIALFRVMNRYLGNLPPMTGVFPDFPAPTGGQAAALAKRRQAGLVIERQEIAISRQNAGPKRHDLGRSAGRRRYQGAKQGRNVSCSCLSFRELSRMDPLLYAREHDLGAQKDKPSRSEAIRRLEPSVTGMGPAQHCPHPRANYAQPLLWSPNPQRLHVSHDRRNHGRRLPRIARCYAYQCSHPIFLLMKDWRQRLAISLVSFTSAEVVQKSHPWRGLHAHFLTKWAPIGKLRHSKSSSSFLVRACSYRRFYWHMLWI
jgi:hypothetical protein